MNIVIIDTETAPVAPGKLNPLTSRVYDVGYIVANTEGVVLCKRSFVIKEAFFNNVLMQSAHYANKLPAYYRGLNTEWQVASLLEVREQLLKDMRLYDVKRVYAYNINFDKKALNATIAACSNGYKKQFFPHDVKFFDIWDMAGSTICTTKKYVKWCISNGYISDKGNPQTSAEVVFRYITKNDLFVEEHTALADCEIEYAILLKVLSRRKKQAQTHGQGWRGAAELIKKM